MTTYTTRLQELRHDRRVLRREMQQRGVRRISFMNGGLTEDERWYNEHMYAIETAIKRELQKAGKPC